MEPLSLQTLQRARDGDTDAYRDFVTAFEGRVHHMVYRLVGSRFPADVEDITQDIFVKLFRSLPQFDAERGTKLSSWVFTFVKNYCFDVLKKKRIRTVPLEGTSDDGHVVEIASNVRGPRNELELEELGHLIGHAVDELPREQKLAFVLREYEGMAYTEIAEITNSSEGTVKSRIHRAKEALRFRLRSIIQDREGGIESERTR